MRNIFALLVLCSTGMPAYSQVTLSGIVLDSATQAPLPLSLIQIGNHTEISDEQGNFTLRDVPLGSHILAITHVGCDIKILNLKVLQDTFITVHLPHHIHAF